jgi:hypothetical protein
MLHLNPSLSFVDEASGAARGSEAGLREQLRHDSPGYVKGEARRGRASLRLRLAVEAPSEGCRLAEALSFASIAAAVCCPQVRHVVATANAARNDMVCYRRIVRVSESFAADVADDGGGANLGRVA